jgi:spermidine synthase
MKILCLRGFKRFVRALRPLRWIGYDAPKGIYRPRWFILLAAAGIALILCPRGATAGSYPKTLYEQPSPYNNILVTEDESGLRTLYFERGGALQSVSKPGDPDHLALPYVKTMLSGLGLCDDPRRILVVGLGGGTIPKFLHKYYPQSVIDAVDIDPGVVKVAREFFEFHEDANLRAFIEDGRKFIEDRPGLYDMIFLDAFGTDRIPYHLATREFLLAVKKALTPRGLVLGNIWKRNYNSLYDSMMRTYQDVFDELHLMNVQDAANHILIAIPRRLKLSSKDISSRARRVSQSKGFLFDMGQVVEGGYQPIELDIFNSRVLTDADKPPGVP